MSDPQSERFRWWSLFTLVGLAAACYAIATPPFAGPDERAHAIRAYAAVRGELIGEAVSSRRASELGAAGFKPTALREVSAPESYESATEYRRCFARKVPTTPASCPELSSSTREVRTVTWQGPSPPAVHLLAGTVTFATRDADALYLMRFAIAMVCAALVASAVVSLQRLRGAVFAVLGVLVALTPMTLFLFGVLNPNAVEIAAALLLWASGTVLAAEVDAAPTRSVDRVGIAGVILMLAGRASILYLVVILAALAIVAGPERVRTLARTRRVRCWAAASGTVGAACAIWLLTANTLDAASNTNGGTSLSLHEAALETFGRTPTFFRQMIGVFDADRAAFVPDLTVLVWAAAIVTLLAVTAIVGRPRRALMVIAALVLIVVALPVVAESISADEAYRYWRGRYTLPLAVGIPILASVSSRIGLAEPLRTRWAVSVGAILVVGQVPAYSLLLQRYVSGIGKPSFFERSLWNPPGPGAVPLFFIFVVIMVVLVGWVLVSSRSLDRDRELPLPTANSTGRAV